MSEDLTALVTGITITVAALFALAAVLSGIYIVYVYRQRKEEALFLTRLVHRNIRVAAASAVILVYLVIALFDRGIGRPWGALIITIAVVAMMYGVISDALLWRKERGLLPAAAKAATDAKLMAAIQQVGEKAEAAYHEANSVNLKIAHLNEQLIAQGDHAATEIRRTDKHQVVQDDRIEVVEGQ